MNKLTKIAEIFLSTSFGLTVARFGFHYPFGKGLAGPFAVLGQKLEIEEVHFLKGGTHMSYARHNAVKTNWLAGFLRANAHEVLVWRPIIFLLLLSRQLAHVGGH